MLLNKKEEEELYNFHTFGDSRGSKFCNRDWMGYGTFKSKNTFLLQIIRAGTDFHAKKVDPRQ